MAVKVKFGKGKREEVQGDLFDPCETWLTPAREFAASLGLSLDKWSIDRTITVGGKRYRVEWQGRWTFPPVE
jgi:hypothetical protein